MQIPFNGWGPHRSHPGTAGCRDTGSWAGSLWSLVDTPCQGTGPGRIRDRATPGKKSLATSTVYSRRKAEGGCWLGPILRDPETPVMSPTAMPTTYLDLPPCLRSMDE